MRTLVLLASACLVGGTVEAQATVEGRPATAEEERRAATAVVALRDGVMKRLMVDDSAAMNRATLGVTLGGAANKRDTLGVFVEAVAEDGPAERAGIFEGHRIAFVNNIDVRASAADAGDSYLSGVGRHRLMKAMRDVSAGSTVALRVWTGSGYRDVQVVANRFADVYKNTGVSMFRFDDGAAGFGPAIERLRIERPVRRRIELRPSESPSTLRLRATPAPGAPPALIAPSIQATPRMMSVPRIAPTPAAGVRRYII